MFHCAVLDAVLVAGNEATAAAVGVLAGVVERVEAGVGTFDDLFGDRGVVAEPVGAGTDQNSLRSQPCSVMLGYTAVAMPWSMTRICDTAGTSSCAATDPRPGGRRAGGISMKLIAARSRRHGPRRSVTSTGSRRGRRSGPIRGRCGRPGRTACRPCPRGVG